MAFERSETEPFGTLALASAAAPPAPVDETDQLDLDTGLLKEALTSFEVATTRFKTFLAGGATLWNGEAGDLLNLPLATQVLETLTPDLILAWGQEGNVRKLLGVLNAEPDNPAFSETLRHGLIGLHNKAMGALLQRGAKSLDALTLSVSLSHSERILGRIEDVARQSDDGHIRSGALAAIRILAQGPGDFAAKVKARLASLREGATQMPGYAAVATQSVERGTAAARVRLEAALSKAQRDHREVQQHGELLLALVHKVTQGPDGAAVRVRQVPALQQAFQDLLRAYDGVFGSAADGAGLDGDARRLAAIATEFADAALRADLAKLDAFRTTLLLERAGFIENEGRTAIAIVDRANFKGLPSHVGSKDRLALMAQAKVDLTGAIEALKGEIGQLTATIAALPAESPGRTQLAEVLESLTKRREDLKAVGKDLMVAVAVFENANRADEASFKRRVDDLGALAQTVGEVVDSLLAKLPELGSADDGVRAFAFRAMDGMRDTLVTRLRDYTKLGGPFSMAGGIRNLGKALEAMAEALAAVEFAKVPPGHDVIGAGPIEQVSLAMDSIALSGLVRPKELEGPAAVFEHLKRLASSRYSRSHSNQAGSPGSGETIPGAAAPGQGGEAVPDPDDETAWEPLEPFVDDWNEDLLAASVAADQFPDIAFLRPDLAPGAKLDAALRARQQMTVSPDLIDAWRQEGETGALVDIACDTDAPDEFRRPVINALLAVEGNRGTAALAQVLAWGDLPPDTALDLAKAGATASLAALQVAAASDGGQAQAAADSLGTAPAVLPDFEDMARMAVVAAAEATLALRTEALATLRRRADYFQAWVGRFQATSRAFVDSDTSGLTPEASLQRLRSTLAAVNRQITAVDADITRLRASAGAAVDREKAGIIAAVGQLQNLSAHLATLQGEVALDGAALQALMPATAES